MEIFLRDPANKVGLLVVLTLRSRLHGDFRGIRLLIRIQLIMLADEYSHEMLDQGGP